MSEIIKGFTPVVNEIAKDVGLIGAAIFGEMWRYAQLDEKNEIKVCTASQTKIGKRIDITRKTVNRYLPKLEKAGYIKEAKRNQYGVGYAVLYDIDFTIGASARKKIAVTESYTEKSPDGTESPSRRDRKSQLDGTESPTKKVVKKDTKKFLTEKSPDGELLLSLQEHLRMNEGITEYNREYFDYIQERINQGDSLTKFAKYWWQKDFRGKNEQAPTLKQVKESWLAAIEGVPAIDPYAGMTRY